MCTIPHQISMCTWSSHVGQHHYAVKDDCLELVSVIRRVHFQSKVLAYQCQSTSMKKNACPIHTCQSHTSLHTIRLFLLIAAAEAHDRGEGIDPKQIALEIV